MTDSTDVQLAVAIAEIERLRARLLELEAAAALTHGSLAVTPETSWPTPYQWLTTEIAANYPPAEDTNG